MGYFEETKKGLPEKAFFTIEDIAERWGCNPQDVLYYGAWDNLRLCVIGRTRLSSDLISVDNEEEGPLRIFRAHPYNHLLVGVSPEDVIEVMTTGTTNLGAASEDKGKYCTAKIIPRDEWMPELDEIEVPARISAKGLVVSRNDLDWFEELYGMAQEGASSALPGDEDTSTPSDKDRTPTSTTLHNANFLPGPTKPHGMFERHATRQRDILGAAFAVLAAYPDKCRSENGAVKATKVREQIDEKAAYFWPDTSKPNLEPETIENHLRDWMRKLKTGK